MPSPSTQKPAPLAETPIPGADEIRLRLAQVLTEAHLLRQQLRVSKRKEAEAQRLASLTLATAG